MCKEKENRVKKENKESRARNQDKVLGKKFYANSTYNQSSPHASNARNEAISELLAVIIIPHNPFSIRKGRGDESSVDVLFFDRQRKVPKESSWLLNFLLKGVVGQVQYYPKIKMPQLLGYLRFVWADYLLFILYSLYDLSFKAIAKNLLRKYRSVIQSEEDILLPLNMTKSRNNLNPIAANTGHAPNACRRISGKRDCRNRWVLAVLCGK